MPDLDIVSRVAAWRNARPVDLGHCPLCGGPFDHEEHGERSGRPENLIGCSSCGFSFIWDCEEQEVLDVCIVE